MHVDTGKLHRGCNGIIHCFVSGLPGAVWLLEPTGKENWLKHESECSFRGSGWLPDVCWTSAHRYVRLKMGRVCSVHVTTESACRSYLGTFTERDHTRGNKHMSKDDINVNLKEIWCACVGWLRVQSNERHCYPSNDGGCKKGWGIYWPV